MRRIIKIIVNRGYMLVVPKRGKEKASQNVLLQDWMLVLLVEDHQEILTLPFS